MIVIPSFGRQSYLRRQVEYWKDKQVSLLILDGTSTAWADGTVLPDNVRYRHMPVSIEERLGYAADHVNTDYAVLLSDDEFFVPSGLLACIGHLDAHPDVVSCKGMVLGFGFKNRPIAYQLYHELRNYSVDGATPRGRMMRHMSPYAMATLWAVMKRDAFCATLRAIGSGGPYKSAAVPELQTSLLASYFGKCHVLPDLMWLRSYENRNIWWQSGRLPIAQWYRDPEHAQEVAAFFSSLEAQIPDRSPEIREWLTEATEAYVKWADSTERSSGSSGARTKLADAAKNAARKVRDVAFPASRGLVAGGRRLARTGVTVRDNELVEIEKVVAAFHAGRS